MGKIQTKRRDKQATVLPCPLQETRDEKFETTNKNNNYRILGEPVVSCCLWDLLSDVNYYHHHYYIASAAAALFITSHGADVYLLEFHNTSLGNYFLF